MFARYDKVIKQINELKASIPDMDKIRAEIKLYEEYAFKNASLNEQEKQLEVYKKQLVIFAETKAENAEKRTKILAELTENGKEIAVLQEETKNLEALRENLRTLKQFIEIRDIITKAEIDKANTDEQMAKLKNDSLVISSKLFDKKQLRMKFSLDQDQVNRINADIAACKTRQELLSKNIAENGKLVGQFENDISIYKDNIARLNQLKRVMDRSAYISANCAHLVKAFSKDGIPHSIVKSVLPILETTASSILNQMSNGRMSVEFKTEKTLTTKREVAALDVIIKDDLTGELPYLSRSGGERVKAALAVILALAEIKSNENGLNLGFLFIDEPPFLDSQGTDAYCEALHTIQNRYSDLKILAITHDPEMKAKFKQTIEVAKTDNGTELTIDL